MHTHIFEIRGRCILQYIFHRNDQPLIEVKIQNVKIKSKKSMNVLGVIFDSKLNWNLQVASSISKAKKKLFALRVLKRFFLPNQMRVLLDLQFYSVLYNNAVIWLTPDLNAQMRQNLLSISANALRTCLRRDCFDISFENLHRTCKKSTPKQIALYLSSLKLHKLKMIT